MPPLGRLPYALNVREARAFANETRNLCTGASPRPLNATTLRVTDDALVFDTVALGSAPLGDVQVPAGALYATQDPVDEKLARIAIARWDSCHRIQGESKEFETTIQ